jgi:hypothetical protein
MEELSLNNEKFEINFQWEFIGEDLLVKIIGGQSHIGAVSLSQEGYEETLTRPTHREDTITKKAVSLLKPHINGAVCVISGIHFDDLQCDEVDQIVNLCLRGIKKIKEGILK